MAWSAVAERAAPLAAHRRRENGQVQAWVRTRAGRPRDLAKYVRQEDGSIGPPSALRAGLTYSPPWWAVWGRLVQPRERGPRGKGAVKQPAARRRERERERGREDGQAGRQAVPMAEDYHLSGVEPAYGLARF